MVQNLWRRVDILIYEEVYFLFFNAYFSSEPTKWGADEHYTLKNQD